MKSDLLDDLFSGLPEQLLHELTKEREGSDTPAAVFTEARKLLEARAFSLATCEEKDLIDLYEKIPVKLKEIIEDGNPSAAHYTEARRLLESHLYYDQRGRTKAKTKTSLADLLQFNEETGEVVGL